MYESRMIKINNVQICCGSVPPPPARRFHLPPGIPVVPKGLIFHCAPYGHEQTLLWRHGTLWFKDVWWSEGGDESTPWERLPTPSEEDWHRLRSKLEQLKIWQAAPPRAPERCIGGGSIDFRMGFHFSDRTFKIKGSLNEDGWREWEDESGNEIGEFDRIFRRVARGIERLTGREWFFEDFYEEAE